MSEHSTENDAGWEPTRWWRVDAPDGSIWCETSSKGEAEEAVRPGDTLRRLYHRTEWEWRVIPPAETPTNGEPR